MPQNYNVVVFFLCRSAGVPGERSGAGKEKEVVLCL